MRRCSISIPTTRRSVEPLSTRRSQRTAPRYRSLTPIPPSPISAARSRFRDDHADEPANRRSARRSAGRCRERSPRLATIPVPASSRSPVRARLMNTKPRCRQILYSSSQRRSRHGRPPHRGGRQRRYLNDSNVAAALISVTATNDAPVITVDPSATYIENAAPVLLSPAAQSHRRGRHRAQLRRRPYHRRIVSRRRRHPDRQRRHQRYYSDWHHVHLEPHAACVGPHRCEFGRELPGVVADGPISIDERQSHRLQRESATDPDLVRIGWHGHHDRNDDGRYHRRERRPGQHRAGRAERRRGHHPADRRRLGGGHRQQRAHHHAQSCRAASSM